MTDAEREELNELRALQATIARQKEYHKRYRAAQQRAYIAISRAHKAEYNEALRQARIDIDNERGPY